MLASLDTRTYTGSTMGLDHPIAWCQDYDGGRSFYLGLGHDATNWTNPAFLQLIAGGIETTAGVVPADCGASVPKNYELVKLDDNTFDPMQLDVAADGRVFYIEREGPIKVIDPTTGHTSAVATLNAFTANESGVLGLALDPDFATNNYVYVFYSPAGADSVDQLSRFTVGADNTFVAGSEKVVLKVPVQRAECCHHGGSMVFDKNTGDLFLATGDNTNPFASDGYAPLDQGAGRAAWDSERTAGNTNSLSGKLLRIHPEGDGTYTVPTGNLFAAGTDKTRPEIYGMGFRNPFRINIDPQTGTVFVADYGPDAGSADPARGPQNTVEWNIIAGPGNYGWPYCTGPNNAYNHWNFATHQSGPKYDCAGGPVNDSPNNTGLAQLPAAIPATLYYHYNAAEDFPEVGGGGAPMAGPMYRYDAASTSDTKWPAYWDGKALFGEWNNNVVYSLLTTSDVRQAAEGHQDQRGQPRRRPAVGQDDGRQVRTGRQPVRDRLGLRLGEQRRLRHLPDRLRLRQQVADREGRRRRQLRTGPVGGAVLLHRITRSGRRCAHLLLGLRRRQHVRPRPPRATPSRPARTRRPDGHRPGRPHRSVQRLGGQRATPGRR